MLKSLLTPPRRDVNVIRKKSLGLVVVALFLVALAGTATAASLDLPRWVIVPEDSTFSDVTLFCPLDAMDVTNNVTPCYLNGALTNATVYFNSTTGYPRLVQGKIGNAFEFDSLSSNSYINTGVPDSSLSGSFSIVVWVKLNSLANGGIIGTSNIEGVGYDKGFALYIYNNYLRFRVADSTSTGRILSTSIPTGQWIMLTAVWTGTTIKLYKNLELVGTVDCSGYTPRDIDIQIGRAVPDWTSAWYLDGVVDEVRIYNNTVLSDDEIKLLYLAGRKKLSEPAQFRQIFSPLIDLTRDRATFYAGLEVSTSDPSGYVPVPESAVNMSITSAPKLVSDYTGAPFYYEGHFWYQAQDIQYSLPIQFETVRQDGNFSHTVLLDEDKKTFVYEKEFKVTNPTGARINVVYEINPLQLGFSTLQYPSFELDGVRMVSWRPNNSSPPVLIATDTLEPGEVSTHWLKSTWTISKEELNFPAKLDDFRSISNWTVARKLAKNAAEGKVDTYVRVIKIDSTADMSNMTVLVQLKDVKDENDVIEAVALTGARDTLQVEKLSDGKVVVKVPGQDFVSGHAEIKVLYNKSGGSWFSQLLEKIRSLMKRILSMFGLGGG